ncbi:MAG: Imm63 family immunity protein [Candidatus Thorarchaeota archaeon]
MSDITLQMACKYELEARVPNQDSRRLIFKKQLELLKKVNSKFYAQKKQAIEEILEKHPYTDG